MKSDVPKPSVEEQARALIGSMPGPRPGENSEIPSGSTWEEFRDARAAQLRSLPALPPKSATSE